MSAIWNALIQYDGDGFLFLFYCAALVWLFFRELDRVNRAVFVYLPLALTVLFLLPPFYILYSKVEESDTYYRILWLIPMTLTVAYAGVKLCRRSLVRGVVILGLILALTGHYTYRNENLLPAQNRLHIPQMVMNISDLIMNDTGGQRTMVAMPVGLVQFVRQYETKILMPYGREMQMPQYQNYDVDDSVYRAVNSEHPDLEVLTSAINQYNCNYVVLETAKLVGYNEQELAEYDLKLIAQTDGYSILRNEAQENSLTDQTDSAEEPAAKAEG